MLKDTPPVRKRPPAPTFTWKGREFKLRRFQPKDLKDQEPQVAAAALVYMTQDYFQLTCLAMTALAKDLYSRQPEGSREFEQFAKSLGLQIVPAEGKPFVVTQELQTP